MKKIALISIIACLGLFASCKNEQKAEAAPQQDAVKESVEKVGEVSDEAAQKVGDALKEAGEAVKEAAEATKDAAEKTAAEVKKEINKK